jgi:hypothetical protein
VLPYGYEVTTEEDRVEYLDKEEYCPLRIMLQCPIRYTIWAWCLIDRDPGWHLEPLRGSLTEFTSAAKVRPQRLVNLNNGRLQRVIYRLKLESPNNLPVPEPSRGLSDRSFPV